MQICFLCFYDIIWDIIFPTTFKVIWYRAWSNCARTHYICIDCWYLARVFWDPGTLHSARTTIQGVDWCSACSVPTLVTLCVRTRIQFPVSCKNRNSSQWLVNQGKTCPEHYFWYFYFCDAVLKHPFGRLEPWLCLDYRTILGLKCFIWKSETIRLCRQDVRKSCRWACVQSFVLTLNTDTKNPVSISVYFCTPPLTIYV